MSATSPVGGGRKELRFVKVKGLYSPAVGSPLVESPPLLVLAVSDVVHFCVVAMWQFETHSGFKGARGGGIPPDQDRFFRVFFVWYP